MTRKSAALAAAAVVVALAGGFVIHSASERRAGVAPVSKAPVAKGAPPTPTLYCEFYNFMHNATVVSFLFAVEAAAKDPRFLEMAVVEPDGTRTEYERGDRPRWTRASDDGAAAIASPDGATRIVLYGFEPKRSGIFWTEAGVRSDAYKNLEGKCRQANFGAT